MGHLTAEGHSGAGYERSPTYNAWRCMKERCFYDKHRWYKRYGGRGITVCDRWLGKDGFKNFLADMKERPSKAHTVDREDSNGNYEPTNCKWATKKEQFDNIERPFGKERSDEHGIRDAA
jgi:hypothetical protein